MHARRYLIAISTTTASFDRVSCLNKHPQVARVDDFRNCRRKQRISKSLNQHRDLEENTHLRKPLSSHLTGMCGEGQNSLHVLADICRYSNLHIGTLREECDVLEDMVRFSYNTCNDHKQNVMHELATSAQSCPPRAHRTWHSLFRKTYRRSTTTTALQVQDTKNQNPNVINTPLLICCIRWMYMPHYLLWLRRFFTYCQSICWPETRHTQTIQHHRQSMK